LDSELLLFFHRHGYGTDGGKAHLIAFHLRDEALVNEVVVALVLALAAIGLGQLDPIALDLINRSDMDTVSNQIIDQARQYPYRQFNYKVLTSPLIEEYVGDIRTPLWILMAAVGFVLLISPKNGIGSGRAAARSISALPAVREPVKPTAFTMECFTKATPTWVALSNRSENTPSGSPHSATLSRIA